MALIFWLNSVWILHNDAVTLRPACLTGCLQSLIAHNYTKPAGTLQFKLKWQASWPILKSLTIVRATQSAPWVGNPGSFDHFIAITSTNEKELACRQVNVTIKKTILYTWLYIITILSVIDHTISVCENRLVSHFVYFIYSLS